MQKWNLIPDLHIFKDIKKTPTFSDWDFTKYLILFGFYF